MGIYIDVWGSEKTGRQRFSDLWRMLIVKRACFVRLVALGGVTITQQQTLSCRFDWNCGRLDGRAWSHDGKSLDGDKNLC